MRLPSGSTRRIFLYAIAAGLALGLLYYGVINQIGRVPMIAPPVALLIALGLGVVLGCCLFVAGRFALRLAAYDLRHTAAEVTGQPATTFVPRRGEDDFAALRLTLTRTLDLLPDNHLHSKLAQAIATSPDEVGQRFSAALAEFSHEVPLSGAALCSYDPGQQIFVPLSTWGLPATANDRTIPADEGPLRRLVRERHDIVMSGAEARLLLTMLGFKEPTSFPIVCVPLLVAEELVGLLILIAETQDGVWSAQRRDLARSLAYQLTVAFREEQVRRRLNEDERDLRAFIDLATALTADLPFERALELMLRTVAALTDSEHGTLLLLDKQEEVRYRISLTQGLFVPLQLVARTVLRSGLAGWALRERRPDIIVDTQRDTRWLAIPGLGEMRSALVVPLLYGERAFGILTLAHSEPRHYGERMLLISSALAAQAVHIIARTQAMEEAVPTAHELDRNIYERLLPHIPETLLDEVAQRGILGSLAAPRRNEAIVVAVALRGVAAASEQLAPEVLLGEVLQPFANTIIEAVRDYSGYLDSSDDTGAIVVFGYPLQTENAASRALAAAHKLQARLDELRARWRTRLRCDVVFTIGVAAGTIITGRVSNDEQQGRYVVLGPAVSWAQRLAGLARTGEVLCNATLAAAYDSTAKGIVLEPLQPVATNDGDEQPYRLVRTA